jgi:hypothetical protein
MDDLRAEELAWICDSTLGHDVITSAATGVPLKKCLPYFHVFSEIRPHHTHNAVFYDCVGLDRGRREEPKELAKN